MKFSNKPLVSILLITFNQQQTIADAIAGALAQNYQPLEILISDDASTDGTFAAIEHAVNGYRGPHQIKILRNSQNLGISGHLSHLSTLAKGELLFVTAGDDISEPQRCSAVVQHWLSLEKKPDLIATDLVAMDASGQLHECIAPTSLDAYQGVEGWAAKPPWLVGAAHAWSPRLFALYGAMKPGVVAEDQIMTLRAILAGGATSLRLPLVRYRRGGLSSKKSFRSVREQLSQMRIGNRRGLLELEQMQADADLVGYGAAMRVALSTRLARAKFARDMLEATSLIRKVGLALRTPGVKLSLRIRMFGYAAWPMLFEPALQIKRLLRR